MSLPADPARPKSPPVVDELFRRALGRTLRELRILRGERLEDTAARAGISPQYLSEVERGRKDPSSEMIGAIVGALDVRLADALTRVAEQLSSGPAQVIDIRSSIHLGSVSATPSGVRPTAPTLSIAA
jgi:transcriptional regulator with XRE-family HTH domain